MFDALLIMSIIGSIVNAIKNVYTKEISAENWNNREKYMKDLYDGVSMEQCLKNAENGKYKDVEKPSWYQEPHRDNISGQIVIENRKLYHEDLIKYGAVQAHKWIKLGRYNLSAEELEIETELIQKHIDYMYNL